MRYHRIKTNKVLTDLLLNDLKAKNIFTEIHPDLFSDSPELLINVKSQKQAHQINLKLIDMQQLKIF